MSEWFIAELSVKWELVSLADSDGTAEIAELQLAWPSFFIIISISVGKN